ncbi:mycothiol S-conjugate amidase [Kitasatospora sp. MAP12-15]|uniref:mycothiol conjugate amidase Mca n=1 Tax=unclassified Kitasatospora TaxID=2633591 RepID=UPI0024740B4E|nr:mycothiol conjugate amidase Mca [Kitasatospora sp. MAP12-44]MDH6113661.1 mycothiol S-conjugate amidase [Kitasatospora sp. MAP12-44]
MTMRLMAVHAHPDDESSKGAATMARYAAEGVEVLVVTCTGGERGDIQNPAADRPGVRENLGAVRRAELALACEILGVRQRNLGFVDSGLPEGWPLPPLPEGCFASRPLDVAAAELVRVVREFRPHVMLTYDPNGGYPHPDHIMCHQVSVAAFESAGEAGCCPGTGRPWQPSKLYYHVGGSHPERIAALRAELRARGADLSDPALSAQLMRLWQHDPTPLLPLTTRVPCGDWFETRFRALQAHETQIDPDGFWFIHPPDLLRAAWPTEDYYLARSTVPVQLPEDDLFAGITPDTSWPPLPAARPFHPTATEHTEGLADVLH